MLRRADPSPEVRDPARRGAFAWALAATLAMFPLIWLGGLTTSHGAGMSVPDWPNTFGYNMFAVPWGHWLGSEAGGVFYEHTHRLLGTLAGLCAVGGVMNAWGVGRRGPWRGVFLASLGLTAGLYVAMKLAGGPAARSLGHAVSLAGATAAVAGIGWSCRRPRVEPAWLRWGFVALLAAVIAQGVLGGLRVVLIELNLAVVHGITGQLTLCLGGLLALASGRWWNEEHVPAEPRRATRLLAYGLAFALIVQLAAAAVMRHHDAGLAVPDFPLHYGQVVPPTTEAGLASANDARAFDYRLPPTTLWKVWLHVAHRLGAAVIVALTAAVVWRLWRAGVLRGHAALLGGLVLAQASLGVLTVWLAKPADVATLHVATGATLLLAAVLLAARLARLVRLARLDAPRPAVAPAGATRAFAVA